MINQWQSLQRQFIEAGVASANLLADKHYHALLINGIYTITDCEDIGHQMLTDEPLFVDVEVVMGEVDGMVSEEQSKC